MRPLLQSLAVGVTAALALACADPAAPSGGSARFAELLQSPAFAVSPARDSAFAAAYRTWTGYGDPGLRTIRSDEAWQAAWDTLTTLVSPQPPLPAVDFTTEMVLLAAHGLAPNTGYSIEITHVTLARDTVFVLAERTRPGANCITGQAGTAPLAARLVPHSELPTVLLTEQYVFDCSTQRRRLEQ